MRVFVTGASGAIGSRLVPQLIDAGHEVIGTHNSPSSAELLRTLGAKPVQARFARRGCGAHGGARGGARGDRPRGDRAGEREVRPQHGQGDGQDQRAANEGHRRAAGGRARGRRAPIRRAKRCRLLPVRPRGRTDQDRGRSARPHAADELPAERRRDGLSRAGGHRLRRDRFALRRLLRRRQRRHDRARSQAAVSDRRRRRRHLVLDPPRRRRRRNRSRSGTRRPGDLQHRRRRSRLRCGSGCRCSPRPSARSRRGASPPGSRGCSQARP